jgi:hypothetical protein
MKNPLALAVALCIQTPAAAALRVSDNGRFLATETGEPVFLPADTAWSN